MTWREGLANRWRAAASELRRYGGESQAMTLETCAAELEAEERDYLFETLSLEQAALEAGVSYDTMSRRIRNGETPNAGRRGKPLVLRRDILAAPRAPMITEHGEPDIAAEALNSRA